MKCLTLLQLLPLLQSALAAPLWPIPSQYALGAQVLWLASNVQVICPPASPKPNNYSLATNSSKNAISSSTIIEAAIERTKQRLTGDNLVPWKFHPRNSNFQPSPNSIKASISRVTLTQNETDPENYYKPLAGGVDESYALKITTSGQVTINAVTSIGLLRGLETLTQLFYKHSQGGIYTPYAPVTITDAPKFPHRGLNMDVSRNYYPPADMKRTIDALSWNKFNRLHLHVVDAQSWPVEIPALPELAQKGPYHNGLTYSPKDLADIQEYGAYRGIEVIIEFDMPGHTAAIALAYPDLITAYNRADWSAGNFSAEPPSGQLKLGNQAVEAFLEELWNDFLPRVSPYTSYMHTGGDEVKANPYTLDPGVHTNDQSVITPLLQKFLDFNHDHVRKAGLTPMVWEEMLLHWNLKLGDDVVVQTWNGATSLPQTVAKGHKALAGDYNFWYLDCGKGQWLDFTPGQSSQTYYPYTDYCTPSKNWRLIYSYDPLASIPPSSTHLVLGGEIHIWSEQTDPVNLDDMVWPRACAAGEVLWSGAKDPVTGGNRSQVEAGPRLGEMRERMVGRGVRAGPVQMPFCTLTGEGTVCEL